MAVKLLVSASGVAHVEGCVRLRNRSLPAKTRVWDGKGRIKPCYSCLFPKQTKRPIHEPCPICGHNSTTPCPHTGVLTVIDRKRGRKGGPQRIHVYPDRQIEADWLRAMVLDS